MYSLDIGDLQIQGDFLEWQTKSKKKDTGKIQLVHTWRRALMTKVQNNDPVCMLAHIEEK